MTGPGLSRKALGTSEPLVRAFARRVQQEGALDLTQGDYKNVDFAPHPEVVRAAQRLTRNTVHSYGPAVGRVDVRGEVVEFINRDGLQDYPSTDVRFLPDEVLFTPGTRSGLAMVLEVLGPDGSGVVVPRPSWEYDWFVERAGKHVIELPTRPPGFLPDPDELDRLLARGGAVRMGGEQSLLICGRAGWQGATNTMPTQLFESQPFAGVSSMPPARIELAHAV